MPVRACARARMCVHVRASPACSFGARALSDGVCLRPRLGRKGSTRNIRKTEQENRRTGEQETGKQKKKKYRRQENKKKARGKEGQTENGHKQPATNSHSSARTADLEYGERGQGRHQHGREVVGQRAHAQHRVGGQERRGGHRRRVHGCGEFAVQCCVCVCGVCVVCIVCVVCVVCVARGPCAPMRAVKSPASSGVQAGGTSMSPFALVVLIVLG